MAPPVDPKWRQASIDQKQTVRDVILDKTLPDARAPELGAEIPSPVADGPDADDHTIRESSPLGEIANGRYLLVREIGRGGMGIVYQARDTQKNELPVALKVLAPDAANTEALGRFVIEARVAASIPHENICKLFDLGIEPRTGAPYIVMELLRGQDLDELLIEKGPPPVEEACGWLVQACSGLEAAHRMGVVHRDVKLSNLFLDNDAIIKVLDFGVSKAPSFADVTRLTRSGAMIGSPVYMAPEQVRNASGVDARADVWSLGVVLYELLAGAPPFESENPMELFEKILTEEPARIRERRPEVPAVLDQIIGIALSKDRERRYPSVDTFQRALIPFANRGSEIILARVKRTPRM